MVDRLAEAEAQLAAGNPHRAVRELWDEYYAALGNAERLTEIIGFAERLAENEEARASALALVAAAVEAHERLVPTDVPPGHAPVYRKTFDVLVQADSYEDAWRRFSEFVGNRLSVATCIAVIEEIYGFEGDDQPVFWEGTHEPWPRYPGKTTIAALTDTLKKAETAFADLDGSMTLDDYYEREINFEAADESPPKKGTMPAPPALFPISISRSASAFIHDHGGSVYVWMMGPPGRSALNLSASAVRPPDIRFQDPCKGDNGETIFLEEGLESRGVLIRLSSPLRSTPAELVAFGSSGPESPWWANR